MHTTSLNFKMFIWLRYMNHNKTGKQTEKIYPRNIFFSFRNRHPASNCSLKRQCWRFCFTFPKNNLNLGIKIEPVTAGAVAYVGICLVSSNSIQLNFVRPNKNWLENLVTLFLEIKSSKCLEKKCWAHVVYCQLMHEVPMLTQCALRHYFHTTFRGFDDMSHDPTCMYVQYV